MTVMEDSDEVFCNIMSRFIEKNMVPIKQNPGQLITIDVMNISCVCATASDK